MSRGPTDSARQAAQEARRNKQAERIAALRKRTRELLAEVGEGIRERATLSHADVFADCSVSRATYFRLRSADGELRDLCDTLFRVVRSGGARGETPTEVSSDGPDHDDEEEIQSLREQVVNLKQQIAAAKIWIDMLEFERAANQKEIKSRTAGMKAARRQATQLGSLVHKMHQLLAQHGIDCDLDIPNFTEKPSGQGTSNDEDTRTSEPPHLQIVANERPERPTE